MTLSKILLLCILLSLSFVKAQSQYRFDQWTSDNGLPQNSVRTIVRTRDGYLWMGTFEGLARFDGVDFTVFDLGNTPELKSNYIEALIEDRRGNLWIAVDGGGLVQYKDGKFHRYSKIEGLASNIATSLFEDSAGNIWIGTENGVSVFINGRFTNYSIKDGLPSENVRTISGDDSGRIWVGTTNGLAVFENGRLAPFAENDRLTDTNIRSLYWEDGQRLWVGTTKGLSLIENGKVAGFPAGKQFGEQFVQSLAGDGQKNLWIGTRQGLYRLNKTSSVLAETLGTPDQFINTIYKDSEDQIWVGTNSSGILRFSSKSFKPLTDPSFQLEKNARAVFEDREGDLWFSVPPRIYRLKDGVVKDVSISDDIPGGISSITEDADGNIWLGGSGVYKFSNGEFTHFSTANGLSHNQIFSVVADNEGGVWVGTYNGLNLIRDGQIKVFKKDVALEDNTILVLFKDRAGAVWVGRRDEISRYRDGGFKTWTIKDGLPDSRISTFFEDRAGTLWIATHSGGLVRFRDEKFSIITTRDGLYDNLAFSILEDAAGNLWMSSNRGIYRTALRELNDFADGKIDSVNSFSYGTEDGMLSRECNGAHPGGVKTRDGKLWFTTVKGLVEIDPVVHNRQPPQVIIERSLINDQIFLNKDMLAIQSGKETLEIKYTAINWKRPSKIKFKYRLDGLDDHWTEVGSRRTAYYSYLPPGEYTFRVIADNGEGVWDMEGKSLKINVLPPFYRTWWFSSLAVLLLTFVIFALVKRRVSQLKKDRAMQQAFSRQLIASQELERKRIAAELHDSLGQRLVVIKNLALMLLHLNKGQKLDVERVEGISAEASQALGEVQEISYNLRPYQLDRIGLTKAVEAIIASAKTASTIEFSTEIDDIDDYFPRDAEINFYRIVQECVGNLVKHSEATEAFVKIELSGENLTLEISDNGKGFTPGKTESKNGGFGLIGLVERSELFGGNVELKSAPKQGTTIKIRLNSLNFLRD